MSKSVTGPAGPAHASRGPHTALVPFLYGVARREELPGVVLVRLLTDLGLSEGAARSLIARMRRDGLLAATPRGRGADYRLAGGFLADFRRARDRQPGPPPAWEGRFHAVFYTVPEAQRAYRDRLRRAATLARYGLMQPGVLISPTDRRALLVAELGDPPPAGTVYHGHVGLPVADAAEVAYRAWDLAELNGRFREHAARLRAAVRGWSAPPEPDGATLAAYVRLLGGALVDTVRVPPLPAELLPADWALPELHAAVGEVFARCGPPSHAYVARLLAAGTGDAVTP
ncbi:PaaX family transcriptional regulator C-terminal domain-containing protein [Nonomuraea sp. NPDC050783]|uniref:PaaX family transcriptional regulator C-terminal domain-containing protein n=1 Tax=Nonomuraea sp. NPDC050783 TaxID=3154634 RepID=UPI003467BA1F